MIPKIIHYCWFGPKKLSAMEKRCIASWKKQCPDYEIRKWTEKDFDFSANSYAREAQSHQAWAFLSDYARNLILAEHGGIYLDTDVELCRPLDPLLEQEGFCGVEEEKIASGLALGAVAHHPVIEALVKLYDDLYFILPDGQKNMNTNTELQHQVFERFGFSTAKSKTIQTFSGMTAYPPEYFCPKSFRDGSIHKTADTFSIHHYHASWASPASRVGFHLRRLAGEKVYSLAQKAFHAPEKWIVLCCFLLTFCQNLRGVLNASAFSGMPVRLLMLPVLLLAGCVIAIQILRRNFNRYWLGALASALIIFAASPWNSMLLWTFLLGGVMACFPFRVFVKCGALSLAVILFCWLLLVCCGVIPSSFIMVEKVLWMKVCTFGFSNANFLSLFLFQLAVFSYLFICRRKWLVLAMIPVGSLIFLFSGGRAYSSAMILIAVMHCMPRLVKRFAVRSLWPGAAGLLLLSLLLGYSNPSWKSLSLLHNRIPFWHEYLTSDPGVKSVLFGRIWHKIPTAAGSSDLRAVLFGWQQLGTMLDGYVFSGFGDFCGTGYGGALLTVRGKACDTFTNTGLAVWARDRHGITVPGWLGVAGRTWDDMGALNRLKIPQQELTGAERAAAVNAANFRYEVVGIADFNGDGKDDVMLQNTIPPVVEGEPVTGAGDILVFLTDTYENVRKGIRPAEGIARTGKVSGDWKICGFGDFNGDRTADVLLCDGKTYVLWLIRDGVLTKSLAIGNGADVLQFAGIADLNRDGCAEVLFNDCGSLMAWDVAGITRGITHEPERIMPGISIGPAWRILAFPDLNGNGKADPVMAKSNGQFRVYLDCDPGQHRDLFKLMVPEDWKFAGFSDIDGDGCDDLLLHHLSSGIISFCSSKKYFADEGAFRKILPLDSAYLQLYVNTGILGVCTFFLLMLLAIRNHRKMAYVLLPVWTALIFAGFFESHVFGSSMLGLLPVYFFFHRKGQC